MTKHRMGSGLLLAALVLLLGGARVIARDDADAPASEGDSDSVPSVKGSRSDPVRPLTIREPTRNPPAPQGESSSKSSLAPRDPSKNEEDLTEPDLTEPEGEGPPDDAGALDEADHGTDLLPEGSPEARDDGDGETLDDSDGGEASEGADGD